MTLLHATLGTPDGAFTLVVNESHVLASGWTSDIPQLVQLIHPKLRGGDELRGGDGDAPSSVGAPETGSNQTLEHGVRAVEAYYSGDIGALDGVPVQQRSGPFREHAWEVLREVRPGHPLSYAEYARRTESPAAIRAAAGACAKNAAALFVPCHRIIRTDGGLGGFRYGVEIKQSLLQREADLARSHPAGPRLESPAR